MTEKFDLPVKLQTEITVLGSILLDGIALEDATSVLATTDFSSSSHQKIYSAILNVWQDGLPVEFTTVLEELQKNKTLDAVGGGAYLAFITEGIPRNPNIEAYVRLIKNHSLARQTGSILKAGIARIEDYSEDPRLIITDIEGQLSKAREEVQEEVSLVQQATREMELIRRQRHEEEQAFVTSGLEEIDFTHGGFALGEMTVIGARPNVGKSTLLRMSVRANCLKGDFSHLLTPEMSEGQVLRLFASVEAGVPFRRVRHATRLTDDDLANVEAAMRDVMRWPLKIEGRSPLTPADAISSLRTTKRKHNTKLAGLDYLQKLKYPGKAADRHVYVTDAMVGLSGFAKTQNVAMVAISSLTEPSGKERNRVPTMEDFRQSGDIKYEANTAILLHREVDGETQKLAPLCSLIFGKARSDETGVKTVYFDSDYVRFVSQQAYLDKLGA